MTARILEGKVFAQAFREDAQKKAAALQEKYGVQPGLAVIIVGSNPASQVYVRNKHKSCEALGIYSEVIEMPETTTKDELIAKIDALNADAKIHGILVQLPLPEQIAAHESEILERIRPEKDVDGFHPYNVGALSCGEEGFVPGTPAGIIELLKRSDIRIDGKECVVIGRSNIVGKPMALLMLRENATVTICHSRTKNLKEICKEADILIVAIGKPKMIDASYVKDGATVIDVGIHRDANNKLCGDVDFASVEPVAGAITPVPGGVGPMTIAMLLSNTLDAAERHGR